MASVSVLYQKIFVPSLMFIKIFEFCLLTQADHVSLVFKNPVDESEIIIFQWTSTPKQAGIAMLCWSDTADFRSKVIIRGKDGHLILVRGTIQQEEIAVVNI